MIDTMKRADKTLTWKTSIVPVNLTGANYRRVHQAYYDTALLWNRIINYIRQVWEEKRIDPSLRELRALLKNIEPELRSTHSHNLQQVTEDALSSVQTYRINKAHGMDVHAPWREKHYRPLFFSTQAWRIRDTTLLLSLGVKRDPISLTIPTIYDSSTSEMISTNRWRSLRLCWNSDLQRHELHISYSQILPQKTLDPLNVIAIDEGIINSFTMATEKDNHYEVTVINGRYGRAIKHHRNTGVARLQTMISKTNKGSKRHRKLVKAKKKLQGKTSNRLRNFDHHVSRIAADIVQQDNTGTIVVGDVRGIEQKTRAKGRANKDQRRRLSGWSRGRQEKYLSEKTGVTLTHIDESYSSQTCPYCLTRNTVTGRYYRCSSCHRVEHRDALGAVNILNKTVYGNYQRIDKPIIVKYRRAIPTDALRSAGNPASMNNTVANYCHIRENVIRYRYSIAYLS